MHSRTFGGRRVALTVATPGQDEIACALNSVFELDRTASAKGNQSDAAIPRSTRAAERDGPISAKDLVPTGLSSTITRNSRRQSFSLPARRPLS